MQRPVCSVIRAKADTKRTTYCIVLIRLSCAVLLNVQQPVGPVEFILSGVARFLDHLVIPVISLEVLQFVTRVKD